MTRFEFRLWLFLIAGWAIIIWFYCWALQHPALSPPY